MNPAEEYILKQPEPYKTIMLHLQVLIETTLPDVDLLFKWKVPFYYVGKSPVCYLNVTRGYVDVGFWNAQYFTKYLEQLESDKRKYVKSLRYRILEDINDQMLIEILEQAYRYRNEKFITG
ncbi:DUF1801 domain-containing protein [Aquimarina sp. AU474]|uniref:DUF1801 domain-containing protein n=1 Tax=Aquimarina sp. AU474 TaxID=2108529 RepID=UPI000D69429A|nr:DUF1801 domain-containing protein [Aquimarina sp. AU474]